MQSFVVPLCQGLLAVLAVSGVGRLALWPIADARPAWHWNLAFTMLTGQAAVNVLAQAVLLSGGGSAHSLHPLAWTLLVAATAGHFFAPGTRGTVPLIRSVRENKFPTAILISAWLANLVVALAPSTKIDELYYHMLLPKRIVEDGALRFYLLPLEQAILPQMHFQMTLSIAHAAGAPDAGNVLSWAYSVVLGLFVAGFLMEATAGSRPVNSMAILCATLCTVGLYATVWHTTGGAHALGDLAATIAVAGILWPEILMPALGPARYTLLLATAASMAASTKLSLWPLSAVATVLIIWRAAAAAGSLKKTGACAAIAAFSWLVMHAPVMIWTCRASGSFWGPVFANLLAPTVFPAGVLQELRQMQQFDPSAAWPLLQDAFIQFSPVFFVSLAWVLWTAWRGSRTSRLAAALLLFQAALVAWKLHFDFRFMGGLEYVAVLAAAVTLAQRAPGPGTPNYRHAWARWGNRLNKSRNWILVFAAIPWLGAQIYYARPFAEVVCGWLPRTQFLERYVALAGDFAALDRMLPQDAVLYIPESGRRLPNFYAPRPVVITPLDLHGRGPVYRLTLEPSADAEPIDARSSLHCGQVVYSNDGAIVETYRRPGAVPTTGIVKVESCEVQPDQAMR